MLALTLLSIDNFKYGINSRNAKNANNCKRANNAKKPLCKAKLFHPAVIKKRVHRKEGFTFKLFHRCELCPFI